MTEYKSIVMIGATGAVGSQVVKALLRLNGISKITLLGRRPLSDVVSDKVTQHVVDVLDPDTYIELLAGHTTAISTLGVGQPSKMSKEQFLAIDRDANLEFGGACKIAGIQHFQLLSSVGVDPNSSSFFLRSKGELEAGLTQLNFNRLSLFHPSMILTPENRYGASQGLTLLLWPLLKPILLGPLRKFRGIKVARLGTAIANNAVSTSGESVEILEWDDFHKSNED